MVVDNFQLLGNRGEGGAAPARTQSRNAPPTRKSPSDDVPPMEDASPEFTDDDIPF